jgi:hypothetical protein
VLSRQVDELAARHAPIRRLLGRYPAWNGVLKRAGRFRSSGRSSAPEARRRDFLVTGLPWSGSDVLCNLLNRAPDTVVVNDPEEISWALEGDAVARRLPLLYRMLRTGVVLEWGTKNRLNERGEILEDSAGTGYVSYVPRVASEDFSLGTRNRLAYLTRLTSLCDELPELGRIATIRHPLATIAAWKEIARHLDTSYVDELVLLADATPLDELQRQAVERIRSEPAPAAKRAVLWALLAELVWRDRDKLLAIRFEDLLADPSGEFDRVSAYLDGARPGRAVRGPAATAPGLVIEDDETDLILSICRESMAKWEYD